MKRHILKLGKYCLVFVSVILFFIVLLILSSSFPSSWIKENVESSAELLVREGNRKNTYIIEKFDTIQFDNYTDALMINTAYSIDNDKPLYSSFTAKKNYVPNVTEQIFEDTAGELRSASKYKRHDEVHELMDTVNKDITESFEYARYWHGYLGLLRPILLIFDLYAIRIMLTVVFISLSVVVLFNIYKKLGKFYMLTFLLGLIGVEYFYMGLSMQGCFIFLITIIFMKIILERYDKIKDISLYFFVVGMITNYLDFLTNPLITLFVPLILYFLLLQKEKKLSIKEQFFIFIKIGFPWAIGYGLTWLSKWVLVDIIYGRHLLETALIQVLFRTQGTGQISLGLSISYNFKFIVIPFLVSTLITILSIIWSVDKRIPYLSFKEGVVNALPYLIIAIVPYIWYIILKDHSYKHAFFTYRNQILTLICIPILYRKFLDISKTESKEKDDRQESVVDE